MLLMELEGYKNNKMLQDIKRFFDEKDYFFNNEPGEFEKVMNQYGFQHVGTGFFGTVYQHPEYPWLIKMFQDDEAYYQYVNYFMHHQDNPHVPRIKGRIIKINPTSFAVRLEKLRSCTAEEYKQFQQIYSRLVSINKKRIKLPHDALFVKKFQQLNQLIQALPNDDLHPNNIMMRNNTFVIIDC
jgi:hypothetical protein